MAPHKKSLIALALLLMTAAAVAQRPAVAAQQRAPTRIVSLIPSVTEMLFAIGAGPSVVGVSNFDEYPPEVLTRTKVGGLIDPDVERILAIKPDLVIVYGTQSDLRTQMDRARVPIFAYEHAGLAGITSTIRALGQRVGKDKEATVLADRIDREIAEIRRLSAGTAHPRTLLVFGRDPEALRNIYASGGIGFLHDMLEAAGGTNVFADVQRQSVQATSELVLSRAPDVILEIREGTAVANLTAWNALGSVPAVRTHRIYLLAGDEMVTPGPRVVDGIRRMREVLR